MILPLGRRILVKPIEETREISGLIINPTPQKFVKCRVIKGKEEIKDGDTVILPANVGVKSDYGLIVGLVDVLAVEESESTILSSYSSNTNREDIKFA